MISVAVWVITADGYTLGKSIVAALPDAVLFVSESLATGREKPETGPSFRSLGPAVAEHFQAFAGHVFVMSTGIAVRMIAPWIQRKTNDPAVVVLDDRGQHCISLLSGHLGGANDLTRRISAIVNARPVISTATDIRGLPAIDSLAKAKGLHIENPEQIKTVNMAIIHQAPLFVHDPYALLIQDLKEAGIPICSDIKAAEARVEIDDRLGSAGQQGLRLRPRSLAAGIGCNRGTEHTEILEVLDRVCRDFQLARNSLACLASIDLKRDEAGLLGAAGRLSLEVFFYSKNQLARVPGIKTPSQTVEQWIGVHSVCEAAAIVAAGREQLIVPKQISGNVTLALARKRPPFTS